MDCRKVRQELSAYIDGVLGEPQLQQLEAHLKGCPHCATEVEELREVVGMVRALGDITPPEEFRGQVMARIKTEAGDVAVTAGDTAAYGAGDGILMHFARRGQFIAVAAVLVLGIGVSVLWGKGLILPQSSNIVLTQDKAGSAASVPAEKKEKAADLPETAKIAMDDGQSKGLAGIPEDTRKIDEQYDASKNYVSDVPRYSITSGAADRAPAASRSPAAKTKDSGKKVISEGSIKIIVTDLAYAESQVNRIAVDLGGRVEKNAFTAASTGRLLTVVIPGGEFERTVAALNRVGEITDKELITRDVSGEYSDLESRIGGLEMKEKSAVGEDLHRIQEELALLREQLAKLGSAAEFATITLEINRQG